MPMAPTPRTGLPRRIVVTGASGNVGTALLRRLAAHPAQLDIVAIARRIPPARDPYAAAKWCAVDLGAPDAARVLTPIFAEADAVVHLAWGFQPSHRRDYLRRVAVDGTRAVMTAAADAGVAHVIHMSSAAVYSEGAYRREVDESWAREGVPTCVYSVDKVAAETFLDDFESGTNVPVLTRFRPGFIGQLVSGSGLERYVLPEFVPAGITNHLPLIPIDHKLTIPAVHSDDVADALVAALERRVPGPFNLGAPTPVGARDFAAPFDCPTIPVPRWGLSALAEATWRLRLQPVQGGWIDLAYTCPMLDCRRAREELGWSPKYDGPEVWSETVRGMRSATGTDSPVLSPRSARERLAALVERGPIGRRIPP
ncbi:NAD-dependent epimerase/dehydratase family protein [Rhodococcus pyridinivorans]|uniref:NAD-dependent epimerase/dehydratase family protein n=1 Tax=Rhodococcus TaxID=1827 RepID=UPI000903F251|nr:MULTISPECIES: NAD-dependent epimerase/dehydratase family protein [Rhodococcus]APE10290.1 epimerase [Rhodococcus sp. 2G]UVT24343.1 NAD-dependent epimerase/dehydratase family protein [Rhodococcus pyridinivorans]